MKKLYSLFVIAAGCLMFASCSDDNDYEPKVNSVTVVSAETELAAAGDSKTIVVNGTGLTASFPSDVTWVTASVSGNNITVTAEPNLGNETRHALLTVRAANGDQTQVSFSQYGAIFALDAPTTIHLDDSGAPVAIDAKFNLPLTVTSSVDWIKVTVDEANSKVIITPTPNTTGIIRFGEINYEIGNVKGSISVEQWEYENDILGYYYLWYYVSGSWNYEIVSLEKVASGDTQLRLYDESWQGLAIPVTPDEENLTMTIANLVPMGSFDDEGDIYQILCFVRGLKSNSIYRSSSTSWGLNGQFVIYTDGTCGWQYDVNDYMVTNNYAYYGISLGVTTDGTYATYAGWLQNFYYMELEKIPMNGAGAKSGNIKKMFKTPVKR